MVTTRMSMCFLQDSSSTPGLPADPSLAPAPVLAQGSLGVPMMHSEETLINASYLANTMLTKTIRPLPVSDHVTEAAAVEPSPSASVSRRSSLFDKGKRRQPSATPSTTPSKRRRRNPLDGNVLPWPISISDFENLERLRHIRADFDRFVKVVDSKIDALESALVEEEDEEEVDPKEKAYWDQVLLDLEDL